MISHLFEKKKFRITALKEIDPRNQESFFSFPRYSRDLSVSLKEFGLLHPVYLAEPERSGLLIPLCGHKRLRACGELGHETVPAFILEPGPRDASEALLFNVIENSTHRFFNGVEVSNILSKLRRYNFPEERTIEDIMPILGLEKSKKTLQDYLSIQSLSPEFKEYIVEIGAPLRIGARLARWSEEDQRELYSMVAAFRPGGNKLKELLDLAEEIGSRRGISPGDVLKEEEVASLCLSKELAPSDKARKVQAYLWSKRYPHLSEKRDTMKREVKGLPLPKGAEIHYPENFEKEELILSLRFSSAQDLFSRLDEIKAKWDREVVERILGILKE